MRLLIMLCLALVACKGSPRRVSYTVAQTSRWEGLALDGMEQNLLGFSDDLLLEIAKREKLMVQLRTLYDQSSLALLDSAGVDAVLSAVQPTAVLQEKYLFSDPYYLTGPVLMVRQGSDVTSLDELNGADVAYEQGAPWGFRLSSDYGMFLHPYDSPGRMMDALVRNEVQGTIVDAIVANKLASGIYHESIKVVDGILMPTGVYLVAKHGVSDHLIESFDAGLKELKEEGMYAKIEAYWDLPR